MKADRAGGLHARRVAKTLVQFGLAQEATVTLAWFPGDRAARILGIVNEHGQALDPTPWQQHVDLTLQRSGETFAAVNLVEVARWGHFGDGG